MRSSAVSPSHPLVPAGEKRLRGEDGGTKADLRSDRVDAPSQRKCRLARDRARFVFALLSDVEETKGKDDPRSHGSFFRINRNSMGVVPVSNQDEVGIDGTPGKE